MIKVALPPLRERPEGIHWLTERVLAQRVVEQVWPPAMSELFLRDVKAREWRVNVRELRSRLEQAVVMSDGSAGKTAEALGISRKTLWEKMKKLQIANWNAGSP